MKLSKKIAATFLAATAITACGRVTENEVAVVMERGAIKEVVDEPKLYCMPMCMPWTDIIRNKTFADTFTISSGSGANAGGEQTQETAQTRQMFLRSDDNKFIEEISVSVVYEVVKTQSVTKLVTEFRADSTNPDRNKLLIRDDLQVLATQPLVDVVGQYNALDLQSKGSEIGAKLAEALQKAVDARLEISGDEISPIKIKSVIMGGVKFDPETESLLKKKIFAQEQAEIAKVAGVAAAEQAKAAAAQADVTAEIVGKISKSIPTDAQDQLGTLTCLDMQRQKLLPPETQCFGIGFKK